jgi:hypothetical protein
MCSAEPVGMGKLLVLGVLAAMSLPVAEGQTGQAGRAEVLTIVNPRLAEIPSERARVLLLTTCRVVAEEFHRKPEDIALSMTLFLGEPNERYAIDDKGHMALYLERWDETKFVDGVITGAMQRLMPLRSRKQILQEIVQRTDKIAPVTANQLPMYKPKTPLLTPGFTRDCISATNGSPCSWPNRVPY